MLPWLFLLFVGVLDAGFYSYALISAQSATRVAALYTSSSAPLAGDSAGACRYALEELRMTPNVGNGVTTGRPMRPGAAVGGRRWHSSNDPA